MTHTYDTYGNLTSSVKESSEGTQINVYKYQYDNQGNILKEEFQLTSTYEDILDYSYLKTYTYDTQGNRITEGYKVDMAFRPEIEFVEYHIEYY